VFFWEGEGGEEGAKKLSQNLPKVSPKFWQNFMSSKFPKNYNTTQGHPQAAVTTATAKERL